MLKIASSTVLVILLAASVLVACTPKVQPVQQLPISSTPVQEKIELPPVAPTNATVKAIVTRQLFSPPAITLPRGIEITLRVQSIDEDHAIWIGGDPVVIKKGETGDVTFKATESLQVMCVDGCEPNVAMNITVEDPSFFLKGTQ